MYPASDWRKAQAVAVVRATQPSWAKCPACALYFPAIEILRPDFLEATPGMCYWSGSQWLAGEFVIVGLSRQGMLSPHLAFATREPGLNLAGFLLV